MNFLTLLESVTLCVTAEATAGQSKQRSDVAFRLGGKEASVRLGRGAVGSPWPTTPR